MSRVLSVEAIPKVSQYNSNMKKMTVVPKYVKLHKSDNKIKVILGQHSILNTFKVILSTIQDIREIGSVASGQAIPKIIKSSLKENIKFSKASIPSQEAKYKESTALLVA